MLRGNNQKESVSNREVVWLSEVEAYGLFGFAQCGISQFETDSLKIYFAKSSREIKILSPFTVSLKTKV